MPALRVTTCLFLSVCVGATANAKETRLIDFEIQDQFHHVHRATDYAGRILVVIGSGKGGRDFNTHWGRAIRDSLSSEFERDDVVFMPVADVRGVPFYLKGRVRRKFPRETKKWALVDWKGEFAEAYNWNPRACNVLVFGRDGALVYQMYGRELESKKLHAVIDSIRSLLPGDDDTQVSNMLRSLEAEHPR